MNNENRELSFDELDQVSAGEAMWCGASLCLPC